MAGSPTLELKTGTPTPRILVFYGDRKDAPEASEALAGALRKAGHEARTVKAADRTQMTMNGSLVEPSGPLPANDCGVPE